MTTINMNDTNRSNWFWSVPSDLKVLIGNITAHKFNFDRYYNKPGQKYYQAPIDVGPLYDHNSNEIGYRIFYRGYWIEVDNVLHQITVDR